MASCSWRSPFRSALTWPRVFAGEAGFLRWAERPIFALAGIKPEQGQHWSAYALALIAFNATGFVLLFLILKFQNYLPWNPLGLAGLSGHLALNTAISFVTNKTGRAMVARPP